MKQLLLTLGIFIGLIANLKGQCPLAGFQLADSVCSGSSYTLTNNSIGTGTLAYDWNFHVGDIKNSPVTNLIGNYGSSVASSFGTEILNDNGNFYLFVQSNTGSLVRYDFGTSINNSPVENILGNIDGLLGSAGDIRFLKDSTNWYAFVNCWNNRIVKLTFGTSLSNIPTAYDLNLTNNSLNFPYHLTAAYDGVNYFILCANLNNSTVTVADLGNSMTNTNATCTNFPINPSSFPTGISVSVDCDQWYGFVTYSGSIAISQVNFGTLLSNQTPTVTDLTLNGSVGTLREIETFREGGNWYGIINSISGASASILSFGKNLGNLNVDVNNLGNIGALSAGDNIFTINTLASDLTMISVNSNNGNITKINFPDIGTITPSTSNLPSPTITLSGSGWTKLSLKVTDQSNGFENVLEDSVYINPVPSIAFTTSSACKNSIVTFIDNSSISLGSITSNNWDLGDLTTLAGDTVTHIYSLTGAVTISLSATSDHGCTSSYSNILNISDNPNANFSYTNNLCATYLVPFIDGSTASIGSIASWDWSFGDTKTDSLQNPLHQFELDGNYITKLVVIQTNGCKDSISFPISIIPTPNADFAVYNTCITESTSFINGTTISGSNLLTYDWSFGDNNSSSIKDPINTYSGSPSNYLVQLISTGSNGCIDTIQKDIRIGSKPNPYFTVNKDTACIGNLITFRDSSFILIGDTITKLFWDFGDNSYDSTSANPSHQFNIPGNYIVKLTAFSPTYCDSTFTKNIVVINSPVASFTTANVCYGESTPFNDLSTTPNGSVIDSWHWYFGDSDSATTQNTNHTYASAGNYNVILVITNTAGCYDSVANPVTIHSLPNTNFTFTKACTNTAITFADSSNVNDGVINNWLWNFGDNNGTSTLQNTSYIYSNSAVYPVTLTTTSSNGCIDSITKYVLVDKSPNFYITANDTCFHLSNKFTYIPVGLPLPNVSYLWNFGDGTFSFLANPIHLYSSIGLFPVTLIITDLNTVCSTVVVDTARTFGLPIANFSKVNKCVNETLQLTDLSTTSSGQISRWEWNFSSHGTSNIQNPSITLNASDSFLVKLTVVTDYGCKDSVIKPVSVYPLPIVSFTPSTNYGGLPLLVNFTNTSSANTFSWNFGDNSPLVNLANPNHIFTDTGSFNVQLIAYTTLGCIDSSNTQITVLSPKLDLLLEAVSYTQLNDLWEIKSRVRNIGNIDILNFDIEARLENKSIIQENYSNKKIIPGQFIDFIFSSKFIVDKYDNPDYLCVKILKVNGQIDDNASNDNKCITASKDFHLFELFPNPFTNYINLGINSPEAQNISIYLYGLDGIKVFEKKQVSLLKGYNSISLDDLHFQSGCYFLEIIEKQQTVVRKIIRN